MYSIYICTTHSKVSNDGVGKFKAATVYNRQDADIVAKCLFKNYPDFDSVEVYDSSRKLIFSSNIRD